MAKVERTRVFFRVNASADQQVAVLRSALSAAGIGAHVERSLHGGAEALLPVGSLDEDLLRFLSTRGISVG